MLLDKIDFSVYDYVIDAIDTVGPKVSLIEFCIKNKVNIISSMGAGGRVDPSMIKYCDICIVNTCDYVLYFQNQT